MVHHCQIEAASPFPFIFRCFPQLNCPNWSGSFAYLRNTEVRIPSVLCRLFRPVAAFLLLHVSISGDGGLLHVIEAQRFVYPQRASKDKTREPIAKVAKEGGGGRGCVFVNPVADWEPSGICPTESSTLLFPYRAYLSGREFQIKFLGRSSITSPVEPYLRKPSEKEAHACTHVLRAATHGLVEVTCGIVAAVRDFEYAWGVRV